MVATSPTAPIRNYNTLEERRLKSAAAPTKVTVAGGASAVRAHVSERVHSQNALISELRNEVAAAAYQNKRLTSHLGYVEKRMIQMEAGVTTLMGMVKSCLEQTTEVAKVHSRPDLIVPRASLFERKDMVLFGMSIVIFACTLGFVAGRWFCIANGHG